MEEELSSLTYRELQVRAKAVGTPSNKSKNFLIAALIEKAEKAEKENNEAVKSQDLSSENTEKAENQFEATKSFSMEELNELTYREVQAIAKKYSFPCNKSKAVLSELILQAQGSEPSTDAMINEPTTESMPSSPITSPSESQSESLHYNPESSSNEEEEGEEEEESVLSLRHNLNDMFLTASSPSLGLSLADPASSKLSFPPCCPRPALSFNVEEVNEEEAREEEEDFENNFEGEQECEAEREGEREGGDLQFPMSPFPVQASPAPVSVPAPLPRQTRPNTHIHFLSPGPVPHPQQDEVDSKTESLPSVDHYQYSVHWSYDDYNKTTTSQETPLTPTRASLPPHSPPPTPPHPHPSHSYFFSPELQMGKQTHWTYESYEQNQAQNQVQNQGQNSQVQSSMETYPSSPTPSPSPSMNETEEMDKENVSLVNSQPQPPSLPVPSTSSSTNNNIQKNKNKVSENQKLAFWLAKAAGGSLPLPPSKPLHPHPQTNRTNNNNGPQNNNQIQI